MPRRRQNQQPKPSPFSTRFGPLLRDALLERSRRNREPMSSAQAVECAQLLESECASLARSLFEAKTRNLHQLPPAEQKGLVTRAQIEADELALHQTVFA